MYGTDAHALGGKRRPQLSKKRAEQLHAAGQVFTFYSTILPVCRETMEVLGPQQPVHSASSNLVQSHTLFPTSPGDALSAGVSAMKGAAMDDVHYAPDE